MSLAEISSWDWEQKATYQIEIDWGSMESLCFHFCEFKYNLNNIQLDYWSEFFFRACAQFIMILSFSGYVYSVFWYVAEVMLRLY